MRLVKEQREKAKAELLTIVLHGPRTTGELQGTPQFHGGRTLSHWQIRTVLRETGKVTEDIEDHGMRTSTLWSLKEKNVALPQKEKSPSTPLSEG
jgi:hypothetical protein